MINIWHTSIFDARLASDVFGALALAALLLSSLFIERRTILLIQSAGSTAFALHFFLLGSGTAALTCAISVLQLAAAGLIRNRGRLLLFYAALLPLVAWTVAATWQGLPSVLAATGALFACAARLQRSTASLARISLYGAPLWIAHNVLVGSVFGLALDAVSIVGSSFVCLRLSFRNKTSIIALREIRMLSQSSFAPVSVAN
jgi:hypothetical protein